MAKLLEIIISFFQSLFQRNTNENNNINIETEDIQIVDEIKVDDDIVEEIILDSQIENIKYQENCLVLLDNGHGSDTSGKRSPYSAVGVKPELDYYEYKWAREMTKKIAEMLSKIGIPSIRIVEEENDITLGERCRRVNTICDQNKDKNIILISIHSNASGMGKEWMQGKGWSCYTTKGTTKSDKLAEYLYESADIHLKGMKIRRDNTDGDSDQESNFYILKNTKCPAVLSENFFHDNIDDVKFLLSEDGKNKIAQTHVDGIVKYLFSE